MVRFPSLYQRLAALVQRLFSPRSRLRRAILRRGLLSGWAAFSRRDFELTLVRYAPNLEVEFRPRHPDARGRRDLPGSSGDARGACGAG